MSNWWKNTRMKICRHNWIIEDSFNPEGYYKNYFNKLLKNINIYDKIPFIINHNYYDRLKFGDMISFTDDLINKKCSKCGKEYKYNFDEIKKKIQDDCDKYKREFIEIMK